MVRWPDVLKLTYKVEVSIKCRQKNYAKEFLIVEVLGPGVWVFKSYDLQQIHIEWQVFKMIARVDELPCL